MRKQSCEEGQGNSSASTYWDLNGHIGIPGNTPPRGGWCIRLRLPRPKKACCLCAVRGRFMLAASLPAVRFRQPIRPGYARATRVRQGRDTLWGCPERAYGCCDAGTGPWGIRKTRGFHLPCGGAGQAIVEKKGFYVSQQISLNHSTLNLWVGRPMYRDRIFGMGDVLGRGLESVIFDMYNL